jgi:Eukaryotic aspartyl protease
LVSVVAAQDVEQMQIPGIIGLGPPQGSVVLEQASQAYNNSLGDPFLNRVFAQNASTPNYITFTLGRTETPNETFPSEFTIGELITGLEAVTSNPQLPVQIVSPQEISGQHWTLQVDAIIGPDGEQINVQSGVPNSNKLVAVLDTGFSFPPVPSAVSDAFYGRVQGAQFSSDDGVWIVPCEQELNVSFVIGNITYPIHPLDTVMEAGTYSDGSTLCIGPVRINAVCVI